MARVLIDNPQDPRVEVYRDLPRRNLTRQSNRMIAEGRWVVERLLASRYPTESILCTERTESELPAAIPAHVEILVTTQEILESIVGFRFHRGILACGVRQPPANLEQLLTAAEAPTTWVICPDVVDPVNLAGIIRNSAAMGVGAVLLGESCADPFSRRVARVSMGTVFHQPLRQSDNLAVDLERLRHEFQFELIATVLDDAAERLPDAARGTRIALLFGGEGYGLSDEWLAQCQRRVTLPMHGITDSLNVSTATGVFLYHFNYVTS